MERIQKSLYWAIIASETSHVFCCVLPTLFSVMSLLAGAGVVAAMPASMIALHEALHGYEIPMIMVSGVVVALGWALYFVSKRIDCLSTGCGHEPCAPKKKKAHTVLKIATLLFILNSAVYFTFHYGYQPSAPVSQQGSVLHGH